MNKQFDFSNYRVAEITGGHILFDNGAEITQYHEQDCCEHVYCDFEQADDLFRKVTFYGEPKIREVRGSGICINDYFIPCYNEQNGYYSSNLSLKFNYREDLDITEASKYIGEDD